MDWDREKEKKAAKNMSVASHIFGIVFLLFWTAIAPSFMKLFGLGGLGLMIYRLYIYLQMSKQEKQPTKTEVDPWDRPQQSSFPQSIPSGGHHFCPYCGYALQEDFAFCPKCGRRTAE